MTTFYIDNGPIGGSDNVGMRFDHDQFVKFGITAAD